MKEKIRAKMEAHVKSIIEKPIITDQEYMLIAGYLSKLEFEATQAESKKQMEEQQKQFRDKLVDVLGGANYGL